MSALVILVAVFGAVVAAAVPIVVALMTIAVAVALVAVVGQAFELSFFVTNMITMMGLAVGIDYSLFVVSRYREERQRGRQKLAANRGHRGHGQPGRVLQRHDRGAGPAGHDPRPQHQLPQPGGGSHLGGGGGGRLPDVLPAVLGLLGDRIDALRVRQRRPAAGPRPGGFWDTVTRGVMARPVASLVVGGGLLVVAAVSAFDMSTGFSGVTTVPDELPSKQAFTSLVRDFPGGLGAPVEIVVDGDIYTPEVQGGIESLRGDLRADPFFGPPEVEVNPTGDLALVSAPLRGDPASEAAVAAIERVREDYVPQAFAPGGARALVGRETAFNKDFFDVTDRYLPIVFGFVLGLSVVLLTVAFRSIVVPLKAIAMNLLSVGAAYGLIVLVSQRGGGVGVLGFQQVEVIEAWLPLFLLSVLFGLSMDYHVFLLSRIREHFDQTGDNTESVAYGLRTTAGIITGAALIMVAVFSGFAAGRMVAFQQMGFGLGVAVLIDATIVRSVLAPASMKLLGHCNWYLPRWLGWLPHLQVEGASDGPTWPAPGWAAYPDDGAEDGRGDGDGSLPSPGAGGGGRHTLPRAAP